MKHVLVEVTRARIVRFQPVDYRLHKALRVEVYGTKTPAGASVFDFELFGCSILKSTHYDKGPDLSNVLQHQLFRFMFIDI